MTNHLFKFLILLFFTSSAQQVVVVDKLSKDPILGAVAFNYLKTKSSLSDFDGHIEVTKFTAFEKIYFDHPSYNKILIRKSLVQDTVFLSPKSTNLNEVVISASKFAQIKKEVPHSVISINSNDVQFSNPQTSADLLLNSGSVFVQKSQLGGGSPMIRGFSTNRLLITIDGVRLNNAIFRSGNVQNIISIDPFNVEKTEVILGSGSVIYGSDAIGGVMNFYTTTPKLSNTLHPNLTSRSTIRYSSANNEKTAHLDFNLGFRKWGFHSSVSVSDFGDLKMGKYGPEDYLSSYYSEPLNGQDMMTPNTTPRIQKFTNFNQIHLAQKVIYKLSNNIQFDFGLHYSTTSDYPRYDRLSTFDNDGVLKYAEWSYGPQDWFLANILMTKFSDSSRWFDKLKISSAYQNFKESRINRKFNSDNRKINKENVDALSFNIDLSKRITDKSNFFYGAEYIYNKVRSEARSQSIASDALGLIASRFPDRSQWETMALYLSHKYKPNTNLTVQSGIRYNYVIIDADLTANNSFYIPPFDNASLETSAITGNLGLSWSPSPSIIWKLNTTTAFRAPNIDDIGKVFDSQNGLVVVPNRNLKPEYAYSAELGLNMKFSDFISLDCSVYYTHLKDALVRKPFTVNGQTEILYDNELSEIHAIQNASKSRIYGFEAGIKVRLSNELKLTSQYSYVQGVQQDASGIELPVRHVAPAFGSTHLIWKHNKLHVDGFISYNATLGNSDISNELANYLFALDSDGNPYAPSWHTLNARTRFDLNSSVSFVGTLENITNQRYRTYSSGITSPGTNFIAAITYTF
ncbi:TonB-dependent receptor [Flavobacteriaceae bacterium]|nr:TonB-dependent receptor [Flavobacteriaceae bacterium]